MEDQNQKNINNIAILKQAEAANLPAAEPSNKTAKLIWPLVFLVIFLGLIGLLLYNGKNKPPVEVANRGKNNTSTTTPPAVLTAELPISQKTVSKNSLPEAFPKDLQLAKTDVVSDNVSYTYPSGAGGKLVFCTKQSIAQAYGFYKNYFLKSSWAVKEPKTNQPDKMKLSAIKGSQSASLYVHDWEGCPGNTAAVDLYFFVNNK